MADLRLTDDAAHTASAALRRLATTITRDLRGLDLDCGSSTARPVVDSWFDWLSVTSGTLGGSLRAGAEEVTAATELFEAADHRIATAGIQVAR